MIRISLCIVMIAVFNSAWCLSISKSPKLGIVKGILKCKELSRQCITECERTTCTLEELCCSKTNPECSPRKRNFTTCDTFQCLNGGKRILRTCDVIPLGSGCGEPLPTCRCPRGFTGRCCQKKTGMCPAYPKISNLSCIHECANDSDCSGTKKCCDRSCSRVCVESLHVPEAPNICSIIGCGPRMVCRNVIRPGSSFLDYQCVPYDINDVCPRAPPRQVGGYRCVNECNNDTDCSSVNNTLSNEPTTLNRTIYKCCHYGCAKQCVPIY
jgi:hypothetical protein